MNPPKWAQDLTLKTLVYLRSKGLNTDVPCLEWRHQRKGYTSGGNCDYTHKLIRISESHNRTDNKVTLLHELAHWALIPKDGKTWENHSLRFWELAWELYKWAKLPIRYCLLTESDYKGSAIAYHLARRIQ